MKLAAIYNVYDGEELLEGSVLSIRDQVDLIIAVVQTSSNAGRYYLGGKQECTRLTDMKLIDIVLDYNPPGFGECHEKERCKRQLGLEEARRQGCTHFLHMDTDEFYRAGEFAAAKQFMIAHPEYDGSACRIKLFVKKPTWTLGLDGRACVPFIHCLGALTRMGHPDYPVAVDPTRRPSPSSNVHVFDQGVLLMYHYSWLRKDISRKLENSSAAELFRRNGVGKSLYDTCSIGTVWPYWNQRVSEDSSSGNPFDVDEYPWPQPAPLKPAVMVELDRMTAASCATGILFSASQLDGITQWSTGCSRVCFYNMHAKPSSWGSAFAVLKGISLCAAAARSLTVYTRPDGAATPVLLSDLCMRSNVAFSRETVCGETTIAPARAQLVVLVFDSEDHSYSELALSMFDQVASRYVMLCRPTPASKECDLLRVANGWILHCQALGPSSSGLTSTPTTVSVFRRSGF